MDTEDNPKVNLLLELDEWSESRRQIRRLIPRLLPPQSSPQKPGRVTFLKSIKIGKTGEETMATKFWKIETQDSGIAGGTRANLAYTAGPSEAQEPEAPGLGEGSEGRS